MAWNLIVIKWVAVAKLTANKRGVLPLFSFYKVLDVLRLNPHFLTFLQKTLDFSPFIVYNIRVVKS